jgi:hypothetical protein
VALLKLSLHGKVKISTKEADRMGRYMILPLLATERMDYLELIAQLSSHIPNKGQVMILYFGFYVNTHRGKVRKQR